MFKKYLFSVLIILFCASANAGMVKCPSPGNVIPSGIITLHNNIPSMMYCSPSLKNCHWKGYNPAVHEGYPVDKFISSYGVREGNSYLIYCDYQLSTGDQIRMVLME